MTEHFDMEMETKIISFQKDIIKAFMGAKADEYGITQVRVKDIPINLVQSKREAYTKYVYFPIQNQVAAKTQNDIDYHWYANFDWDQIVGI